MNLKTAVNPKTIRPPAVAGSFYPADPSVLKQEIDGYLRTAKNTSERLPKVLVCPHAGTIYSGKTAGIGYAQLAVQRGKIQRVVLFGPTHRVGIHGLAVPSVDAFFTPLGVVPIDAAGREKALQLTQVIEADPPHAYEHSLEVQLPFLQRVLETFSLLPFAVGDASPAAVAEVMENCWGGDETLIVISSDLSHFHTYHDAQRIDRGTINTLLTFDASLNHDQACGATPLNGLLQVARRRHLKPTLLDLCNSGDTAGDQMRVVGYAALRFDEPAEESS